MKAWEENYSNYTEIMVYLVRYRPGMWLIVLNGFMNPYELGRVERWEDSFNQIYSKYELRKTKNKVDWNVLTQKVLDKLCTGDTWRQEMLEINCKL